MPKFNPIKLQPGQEITQDIINRLQQAISNAFSETVKPQVNVVTGITGNYSASDQDQFLITDSNPGPVVISLPIPIANQFLIVHNPLVNQSKVTVKGSDGSLVGDKAVVEVPGLGSVAVLANGKSWNRIF